MRSEAPWLRLEDVVEDILDRRGVTPLKLGGDFTSAGHRVISAKLVKGGRIRLDADEPRYVDELIYQRWMRTPLRRGDVIMTSEAPLGELAFLGDDVDWVLGQRLFAIRPKAGRLDGRFLYYALQTEEVRADLLGRASGTTVQGIRQAELRRVRVPVPDRQVQVASARLLGALDDRIDLLRQTNATLESIAQALFKSWFIDFDPVRAKAEGREPDGMNAATAALFPASKADWQQLCRTERVEELVRRKSLAIGDGYRAKNSELGEPGVAFVRAGDLDQGRVTPTQDHLSSEALARATGKQAWPGDTAFTSKGTIGRFAFVDSDSGPAVYSPQVCFWRSLDVNVLEPTFLHYWMKSALFGTQVDRVRGQAAIMDFVSLSDQRRMTIDIPPPVVQRRFADVADNLVRRIGANRRHADVLAALRDALLSRLISGKLRLPEAQAQLEEALA